MTPGMLSDLSPKDRSVKPVEAALIGMEKLLGDKIAAAKANPEAVKERAIAHYVDLGTHHSDPFFLERAIAVAICDISNKGDKRLFRLSFPHIENLVSAKLK